MALINVKKKVEKASDKLGISEEVAAACTTNPAGTMKRMLSKELGGALGSAISGSNGSVEDADSGLAGQFPSGQHFLVLTDDRLLVTSMSVMTGKPKEIVAEWPRENVVAIEVEKGRMAAPLTVAFTDGTAVQVEGAKGTDPASVAAAFGGEISDN